MTARAIGRLGAVAEQRWGLITTAQAERVGVSRKAMAGLASCGALTRVAQGVYRMAGAPELENEDVFAAWLSLGGATTPPTPSGVPAIVAAGKTAAILHRIGNFFPDGIEFIVPSRRATRLLGVRLRTRQLEPDEVTYVDALPTLTIERTIADLVGLWEDLSLVADALSDAAFQGRLLYPERLAPYVAPFAAAHGYGDGDGAGLAAELMELAGISGPARDA